jgi:hypothetical protein
MNIKSLLRAGALALLLTATVGAIAPAFAAQTHSQQGVYDGKDYQAAKAAGVWF